MRQKGTATVAAPFQEAPDTDTSAWSKSAGALIVLRFIGGYERGFGIKCGCGDFAFQEA